MLTRCPLCNTTFRVTAEQIKARQGRVRCGACQEVFNALDHLIEAVVVPATPQIPAPAEPAAAAAAPVAAENAASAGDPAQAGYGDDAPRAAPSTAPEADLTVLAADFALAPEAAGTDQGFHAPLPGEPAAIVPEEPGTDHGFAAPGEETAIASPAPALEPEPALPATPEPPPAAEPAEAEPEPVDFSITPGLTDEAPRRRAWPWALAGALAVIVLAAQAALHFRTALATAYPDTKPALVAACAALGCEVKLPHRHELVSIEASDLSPDPGGKLLLALTMKNRAAYAQEYPHLELTLTDTADGPLVRRVLAPAEYLPPQTSLAAGFGANAELTLSLLVETPGIAASGYRLYLFYP